MEHAKCALSAAMKFLQVRVSIDESKTSSIVRLLRSGVVR